MGRKYDTIYCSLKGIASDTETKQQSTNPNKNSDAVSYQIPIFYSIKPRVEEYLKKDSEDNPVSPTPGKSGVNLWAKEREVRRFTQIHLLFVHSSDIWVIRFALSVFVLWF